MLTNKQKDMEINEALEILKQHNKWRRNTDDDLDIPMTNPKELGVAIDMIIEFVEKKLND